MECEYDKRKKCDSLYIERYNKLLKENKELKSIIKEAIEYINWNLDVNEEVIDYFNFDANFNKLLEILQGSDKE